MFVYVVIASILKWRLKETGNHSREDKTGEECAEFKVVGEAGKDVTVRK